MLKIKNFPDGSFTREISKGDIEPTRAFSTLLRLKKIDFEDEHGFEYYNIGCFACGWNMTFKIMKRIPGKKKIKILKQTVSEIDIFHLQSTMHHFGNNN